MRLIRQILLFLILNSIFIIHNSSPIYALASFSTDYVVTYDISQSGQTHVTFNIGQKNNLSTVYATSFSLSLSQTNLKNILVKDASGPISPQISQTENVTNINFDFGDKVVGRDKVNQFLIQFDSPDIASKQGSIWEINIPKLESNENTNSQKIILKVPGSFGEPAYIDPKPIRGENNSYVFTSTTLGNKSISAVFGTTQFYKLRLTYNLNNPLAKNLSTQIAIPPDTAYQTVYLKDINPRPKDIAVDPDGNWLASYVISPDTDLQVTAELYIKLSFNPKSYPPPNRDLYTRATKLWDYEDPDVAAKASGLTTPKSVYDFVTSNLSYSYGRIGGSSTPNRTGAVWALTHPQDAICTEFTDLFIALARKNGILARENQGFAMSTNDKLKPLSLGKDVLHAWPEYYDQTKQTWMQVDPTWGNTTGGIDYFNKLDLNHLVFVIHGLDSTQPLPAGSYKTTGGGSKDVFVQVTDPITFPNPTFEVNHASTDAKHLYLNLKNTSGISSNAAVSIIEDQRVKGVAKNYLLVPFSSSFHSQPVSLKLTSNRRQHCPQLPHRL
ncbi:transglutaminase family protein [Candidatus Collierbacteria bacterium]|nr:transglutaminase family protein [Candidatus Collierbacteria bacterium]